MIKLKMNESVKNDFIKYKDFNEFSLLGEEGKKIFVIESKVENPKANVFIISPYSKSAHESMFLCYYLLKNGFNVIRFDGINNNGISSGTIQSYTLSQVYLDIERVVAYVSEKNDLKNIFITLSLSFPIGLKYVSNHTSISQLIGIVGVIDVKATVERASGKSLDSYMRQDKDAEQSLNVFGYDVDIQVFVNDMKKNGYTNIDNTIQDLKKVSIPIHMIVGQKDEYVYYEEFLSFKNYLNAESNYIVLENASHEIGASLNLTKKVGELVASYATGLECEQVNIPPITEVIRAASIEAKYIENILKEYEEYFK